MPRAQLKIVFGGPSLFGCQISNFYVCPPARLGSVYWAWEMGADTIVILDGYFGSIPSVWHKEILFALSRGVRVYGASSMGALRAAELERYGMVGFGKVFRLFRSNVLTNDDEVCLLHAGSERGYRPLTIPLVNIRLTLRQLRKAEVLSAAESIAARVAAAATHFSERDSSSLRSEFLNCFGTKRGMSVFEAFQRCYVDQKKQDAVGLLDHVNAVSDTGVSPKDWAFPATLHWTQQFQVFRDSLPSGEQDVRWAC